MYFILVETIKMIFVVSITIERNEIQTRNLKVVSNLYCDNQLGHYDTVVRLSVSMWL
jgi:hypothetical protein